MKHALVVVSLVVGAGGPLLAQTTFNPSLSVDQGYTDNVSYSGSEDDSDTFTTVSADLPVQRTWRTGSLDFSYAPSFRRHADFDELDNDSHRAAFGINSTPSRRANFGFRTSYQLTQDQAQPGTLDPDQLFLTRRTDRRLLRADLDFDHRVSDRWTWSGNAGYGNSTFDVLRDFEDPDAPEIVVEDHTDYGGGFAFHRDISPATGLGLVYGWRRLDLDRFGEETVNSLGLSLRHTVSRRVALEASLGAFQSRGEAVEEAQGEGEDTRSGADLRLALTRNYQHIDLRLEAAHQPAADGAIAGSATDSALGLFLAGTGSRSWFWSTSARYARRDPTADDEPVLDTASASASLERSFLRVLGLRLAGSFVDQSSDLSYLDTGYVSANLGLVWYPLGRLAVAGR